MRRFRWILPTLVIAAIAILAAVSSARVWQSKLNRASLPLPAKANYLAPSRVQANPLPLGVAIFTAPGLRGALESASANKSSGRQTITCTVANRGQENLKALEVVLLAFTAQGQLARAEGRLLRLDLTPSARQTVAFTTELSHEPTQTLMLAIKGVRGQANKQEIKTQELIEALVKQKVTGAIPTLIIKEQPTNQVAFTPNVCYESFRLAHDLARNSGNLGVGGNVCDQYRQAFSIAFFPVAQN